MSIELKNTIVLAFAFLALFCMAELLYHFAKFKAEITRKLVHFGTGLLTMLFPIMLNNKWLVLFLCASFALILLLSLKFNLLKSINAIERKSFGSLSYPAAVFICYCFYDWYREQPVCRENGYIAFYLPVLILAICDPLAALTGRRWPLGKYSLGSETKSMMGSGMFFVSAFALSFTLLHLTNSGLNGMITLILASAIIALATAVTEGLSRKGLDNLFIPFTAFASFYLVSLILLNG